MCNTIKFQIKVTRVKSEHDEFRLICPYDCRHISKSYHALRVHLGRAHSHESDLGIYLKNIGKVIRSLRRVK